MVDDGGIVDVARLESALNNVSDVDSPLIPTGFESKRGGESYWEASLGFDASLCGYV